MQKIVSILPQRCQGRFWVHDRATPQKYALSLPLFDGAASRAVEECAYTPFEGLAIEQWS